MSTKVRNPQDGTEAQDLPADWEETSAKSVDYRAIAVYTHAVTGQQVVVRKQKKPTQLHTPETSTNDTGYRTLVQDDHIAPLTYDLSAETVARDRAHEFMAAYPEGDFEIPDPADQPYGGSPVGWDE